MTRIEINDLLNEQVMQTSETCNLVENMQLTMCALAGQIENIQADQRQQSQERKTKNTWHNKLYALFVLTWLCYFLYRVLWSVYYAKKMNGSS